MSEPDAAVSSSQPEPLINLDSSPQPPPAASIPATDSTRAEGNGSTLSSVKESVVNTASSAMAAVQDNPVTDSIVNGPVGQAVQSEKEKTSAEFKDLANARTTPEQPAATGQPLTHYHSLFYRLLSWKNPRATAITFATTVAFIFAARYLNVLRYTFKFLYTVLGVTALAEGAGKAVLGNGFATQFRPRKYWTIRKESLERFTEDVEQLINFVVIEFQRVVFVENIYVTVAAFATSFVSYYLIKWLPLWGLSLIFTVASFLGPLVYIKNQEFIDAHINHAGEVIGAQANQVRDIAAQHTSRATETVRSYAGEYTQKAQEYIGQARGKVNGTTPAVKQSEFPAAPKNEPFPSVPTATAGVAEAQPVQ